ncbi:Kiwa anti-phage protein KwaB-like domain-containing protein [Aeromonas hydrophila]|uniref:Kiwa anti-phage protein KwaB-like domain-containing protein n=1 Tax=Aeromonas hydrophila TaxID=644 RepID=UPI002B4A14C7|nr:Kiwa anti-phage protein KwaB-like domain-containing protein [Aeromonas hydrophila]
MFQSLDDLIKSSHISGEAYFVINNAQSDIYRVLLEAPAEKDMTREFCKALSSVVIEPNSGKTNVPVVSSLLERDKQVFEYDHLKINHLPPEFKRIEEVSSSGVNSTIPKFDFKSHSLSHVKGVIYHLSDSNGNNVTLYQHKYPVSLHKKTKLSYCSLNGRTLGRITDDSIDINNTIDFLYLNQKFYVTNVNLLERFYGLETVIDNLAKKATPLILALQIVDVKNIPNPIDIFDGMHKDRRFMKTLAMVAQGTIVQKGINISQIKQVMSSFPIFQRKITIENNLVILNTKEQKRYFIRLLNNEASFTALDNTPFLAVEKDSAN